MPSRRLFTKVNTREIARKAAQRVQAKWDHEKERVWASQGIKLTVAEYESKIASQFGRCAICGEFPIAGIALAVDHNHRTGQVRGLLCSRCNFAIGHFESVLAPRFAMYLEQWNAV